MHQLQCDPLVIVRKRKKVGDRGSFWGVLDFNGCTSRLEGAPRARGRAMIGVCSNTRVLRRLLLRPHVRGRVPLPKNINCKANAGLVE